MPIVTGDTKVVQRGAADGLFITTTGVGEIVVAHEVSAAAAAAGDVLLLSGTLGDHALAVLAARGEFNFSARRAERLRAALGPRRGALWRPAGAAVHFLRDPTRGGLATVLAELAEESGLGIEVEEEALPVSPAVRSACDLLGYDPLALANEGKMVFAVAPEAADAVLGALRGRPEGARAARIGARHRAASRPRRAAHRLRHAPRARHAGRRAAAAHLLGGGLPEPLAAISPALATGRRPPPGSGLRASSSRLGTEPAPAR